MEMSIESRRLIVCCLLFAAVIGSVMVLLNVPARIVRINEQGVGMSMMSEEPYSRKMATPIEKAGWPLTYRIRFLPLEEPHESAIESSVQTIYFSWSRLLLDALIGLFVMVLVAQYTRMRQRHILRSQNPIWVRRFYDFTTASCCFTVPLIVFLISSSTARRHAKLAEHIVRYGHCTLAAEVPQWMAERVPQTFAKSFLRITDVGLVRPTGEILAQLNSIDTLRSVRIQQSNMDSTGLRFLNRSKMISSLTLAYCRLDHEAIEIVASTDQLRWLSLTGCPLDNACLRSLDRLTSLEGADLSETGIRLSEFRQPGWVHSMRRLRLPRPHANEADQLRLIGWTELSYLCVRNNEQRHNDATLTLELVDCPKLTTLNLDRWQKHALIGINLPRLRNIYEPVDFSLHDYTNQTLPEMTRWQKVHLENLLSLTSLECQASDLESIQVSNTPQLQSIALGTSRVNQREQKSSDPSIPNDCGENFVNAISQLDSLNVVRIEGVRLTRDDLKGLCRIRFLQELQCVNTELSDMDLAELETKHSLQFLDVGECAISEQRLANLVKLPRLKTICANLSRIERLQIANDIRIESLETRPLRQLRTLELMDLPRYCGNVVIQNHVDYLCLRSVPLLRELLLECPWPEDYHLEGVSGLERFAGGGPNLRDSVLDQLVTCRELDQLSLAYPQLSREKMKRISEMKQLTSLEVPGCPIDDDVVSHWNPITRLRHICLDDTAIGSETIRWLATLESLRSVSMGHLHLDAAAQAVLPSLNQVTELSLVQTELSDEAFAQVLKSRSIEILNLSKTKISRAKLEAISRSDTLKYCVFNDCGLSAAFIEQLFRDQPELHIEINNTKDLPTDFLARSDMNRIHDASTSDRWSHRIGQEYRSTLESADHGRDPQQTQYEEQLVSRPFSLALFRKQPQS